MDLQESIAYYVQQREGCTWLDIIAHFRRHGIESVLVSLRTLIESGVVVCDGERYYGLDDETIS
jgi:hypothetical protein